MKITIGETVLSATLADNSSAEALKEKLAKGPVTIHMDDYASMEKVGDLGFRLPTNARFLMTARTPSVSSGSSADVGSSKKMISGSSAMVRAMATLCC